MCVLDIEKKSKINSKWWKKIMKKFKIDDKMYILNENGK